jgi:hypothetical protein
VRLSGGGCRCGLWWGEGVFWGGGGGFGRYMAWEAWWAARRGRWWLTVGSSPKTSSPTGALAMASSMAGVGWVMVSLRRSMVRGEVVKVVALGWV